MQTRLVALAVAVVLAILAYGLWADAAPAPGDQPVPRPAGPAATGSAAAAPPRVDAPAVGDREPIAPPVAPAASRFAVRLRGLDAAAPWTALVHFDLEGKLGDAWRQQDAAVAPVDGVLVFAIPDWAAAAEPLKLRLAADDPCYLPLEMQHRGPLPPGGELIVDVQVVAVLQGRVVDPAGQPVVAARITAFAVAAGVPLDKVLGDANSGHDGTFVLQAPPATPLYLLAMPLQPAQLSGRTMVGRNGAVYDAGEARADLLPAALFATGSTGQATVLGDIALPAAARLVGVVRWRDGTPVPGATVRVLPAGAITLALRAAVDVQRQADGSLAPLATARTDAAGAFALPVRPRTPIDVAIADVDQLVRVGPMPVFTADPQQPLQLELPLPVQLRATADGNPVPGAELEFSDGQRQRAGERGERSVLLTEAARVRARDGDRRSAWVPLEPAQGGHTVTIDLRERLAELRIEFTGEFRVRNALFAWTRVADRATGSERLLRDDRSGPFRLALEPGRYRLRIGPSGGEYNGLFLLPIEQEVEVGPGGASLTIPARLGGRLLVAVQDARGLSVPGHCRIRDAAGVEHPTRFFVRGDGGGEREGGPGELLGGPSESIELLVPGDYECELDLGAHGVQRHRVAITARAVAELRVRLP